MAVVVDIDTQSGCCFGVVNAIRKAEEQLEHYGSLYCLGDMVHNSKEVERLRAKGLKTLTHEDLEHLHHSRILFRAHGEPPSTYRLAGQNDMEIIDATCRVVLRLQKQIRQIHEESPETQILIFGKSGHAEVNGLVGQAGNTAKVIECIEDLDGIDYSRPVVMFSQTTKSSDDYKALSDIIQGRMAEGVSFQSYDTICRHFAGRLPQIKLFAAAHDCMIFVGDPKSSNGKALYKACTAANARSYFVSGPEDLRQEWFRNVRSVGISGATSTPAWLMEKVRDAVFCVAGTGIAENQSPK